MRIRGRSGAPSSGPAKPRSADGRGVGLLLASIALVGVVYGLLGGVYAHYRVRELMASAASLQSQHPASIADLQGSHPGALERLPELGGPLGGYRVLEIERSARLLSAATQSAAKAADVADREHLAQESSTLKAGVTAKLFGPEQFLSYCLATWSVLLVARQRAAINRERREVDRTQIASLPQGALIRPEDVADLVTEVRGGEGDRSAVSAVLVHALRRFQNTRDVSATEQLVRGEVDARATAMHSELTMVRFCIWAIPSIGFIGTVRGIGGALGDASGPERLPEVVGYLGIAFDTTFVALLLSIALMLVVHDSERKTDRFLEALQEACLSLVVRRLDPGVGKSGT